MARSRRAHAVLALLATTTLLLSTSACLSDSNTEVTDTTPPECPVTVPANLYTQNVTLTWWHNYNVDAVDPVNNPGGKEYWQKVADDFHALHPTVTIKSEGYETNDLQRNKIPAALKSGDAPDIFQAWGGGELADQVEAGYVQDLSCFVATEQANLGGATDIWKVGGHQYGLPYQMGIEGIWYNKAVFEQAGITATPKTQADVLDVIAKLKAINVAPFAVAAGDSWTAGHWWYQFAIHTCSNETIAKATSDKDWSDPCWVQAGEQLQQFLGLDPFQDDFLGYKFGSQPASGSLLLDGTAAMELMGGWNKGTIEGLSADGKGLGDNLGWFPVPAIGTNADQATVALGGGDGYACYKDAPPECVEFLKYLVSPAVQTGYAALGVGTPLAKGSDAGIADPITKSIFDGTAGASSVQLWLDTQWGSGVGDAMNGAIVKIFDGSGTPQGVVDAIVTAASR